MNWFFLVTMRSRYILTRDEWRWPTLTSLSHGSHRKHVLRLSLLLYPAFLSKCFHLRLKSATVLFYHCLFSLQAQHRIIRHCKKSLNKKVWALQRSIYSQCNVPWNWLTERNQCKSIIFKCYATKNGLSLMSTDRSSYTFFINASYSAGTVHASHYINAL